MRTALAGLGCLVAILGAACGEEKRPPDVDDADTITASVGRIVFHCRSAQQGFLAGVDKQVLGRDVDALRDAAEEIDPDVSFRLPEGAIRRQTTLRDQVELAARVLDEDCSPADAERLREAVGD
jgi:hypothetical protein